MNESRERSSLSLAGVVEIALLILLLPTLGLVAASREVGNDEGMWSYIGRVWVENGIPPYTGTVENKTPGIFLLNAAEYSLWGLDIGLVRGVGVAAILLSGLLIYRMARLIDGHRAGVASGLAFCLSMVWHPMDGACTAQTETFMVLFSITAFGCLLHAHQAVGEGRLDSPPMGWIFAAGLTMGAAIAFKQIAVTSAGALLVSYLILFAPGKLDTRASGRLTAGAFLLAIGVLVATALSVAPLLYHGVTLSDYWEGAWRILLNPASSESDGRLRMYRMLNAFTTSRIVVFYPFLCIWLFGRDGRTSRYSWCLLVWLVCDVVGANASGFYFGHQIKQVLPTLSLICGLAFSGFDFSRRAADERASRLRYPLALIGLFLMFCPFDQAGRHINRWLVDYRDENVELGRWIRDHTAKNDYVFIHAGGGNPTMSFSGRVSPSRFFSSIFVTNADSRREVMRDLLAHVPRFFLRDPGAPGFDGDMAAYVKARFRLLRAQNGFEIYERNDPST